ncbi:MAG: LemA family protein [Elusimicrobia bacterium]|nr:LemA family protein [Elusimicrobiota bacterium]
MKKGLIIIFVLVILIGVWIVKNLNYVVQLDERVNEAWAEIENQLKRRNDLIPNLVETVKGYAKHEKEIFENVADSRAKLSGLISEKGSIKAKIQAANELGGALSRLLAIVENYPDLKANQNFIRLQDELAGTENRIAVARMRYNRAVKEFNTYRREIFGSIFAKMRGLTESRPYWKIEEKEKETPKVKF